MQSGYDFAFALPYYAGLTGSQFVMFNNMQPSQNEADKDNLVSNWVQITNLETSEQRGLLVLYDQRGEVLASESINLLPETRRDFSVHHLGSNLVGLVEWRPENTTARFSLRNTRYYYDNPEQEDSFYGGVQLEGMRGNGETLSAVLDTRGQLVVLEVANTTASDLDVMVEIYNAAGELVKIESLDGVRSYSSRHLVVNEFLSDQLGMVTIDSSRKASVLAVAMHYGKNAPVANYTINYVYGFIAREALGSTMHGSYNTYLGQGCELQLVNSSNAAVSSIVEMKRLNGEVVISAQELTTPAKGAVSFDVCSLEEADQYGVVSVTAATRNTVLPVLIRSGANNDYRFVTPVR